MLKFFLIIKNIKNVINEKISSLLSNWITGQSNNWISNSDWIGWMKLIGSDLDVNILHPIAIGLDVGWSEKIGYQPMNTSSIPFLLLLINKFYNEGNIRIYIYMLNNKGDDR